MVMIIIMIMVIMSMMMMMVVVVLSNIEICFYEQSKFYLSPVLL
jgi:hypothetical protein